MPNSQNSFGYTKKDNLLICNFRLDENQEKNIGVQSTIIEIKTPIKKPIQTKEEIKETFLKSISEFKKKGSAQNSQIEENQGFSSLFFKISTSPECDSFLNFQVKLPDNTSQIPPETVEKAFHLVLDSFLSIEKPVIGNVA